MCKIWNVDEQKSARINNFKYHQLGSETKISIKTLKISMQLIKICNYKLYSSLVYIIKSDYKPELEINMQVCVY